MLIIADDTWKNVKYLKLYFKNQYVLMVKKIETLQRKYNAFYNCTPISKTNFLRQDLYNFPNLVCAYKSTYLCI